VKPIAQDASAFSPRELQIGQGHNAMVVHVWPIGYLAKLLKRTPHTIRCWERNGTLPAPVLRSPDGIRHYTREEIQAIVTHAQNEGLKNGRSFEKTEFKKKVRAEFALIARKYGVRQ
jgi:hypothetical protein